MNIGGVQFRWQVSSGMSRWSEHVSWSAMFVFYNTTLTFSTLVMLYINLNTEYRTEHSLLAIMSVKKSVLLLDCVIVCYTLKGVELRTMIDVGGKVIRLPRR